MGRQIYQGQLIKNISTAFRHECTVFNHSYNKNVNEMSLKQQ